MTAEVHVAEWPYFIWKLDKILSVNKPIKSICCVKDISFNWILEKRMNESKEEFRIYIEEMGQKKDVRPVKVVSFIARTYIIDPSEEKHFQDVVEINFTGVHNYHYVWGSMTSELQDNFEKLKQDNGEILLICVFEPKTELKNVEKQVFSDVDGTEWCSLQMLSHDFGKFRNSPGDLKLKCRNAESLTHSSILSARCTNLVNSFMNTDNPVETNLDLDKKHFEHFLNYVYSGCLPVLKLNDAQILHSFGSKYEMKDLMSLCTRIMISHLSKENVYELLLSAHNDENEEFKNGIAEYIIKQNLLVSDEWLSFAAEHQKLALYVYRVHAEKN